MVEYQTQGGGISDGVQKITINTPFGVLIKGKTIGDKIKVGKENNLVEIIEIN